MLRIILTPTSKLVILLALCPLAATEAATLAAPAGLIEGLASYQVFPRTGQTGSIPFRLARPGAGTVTVTRDRDGKVVASRDWEAAVPTALSLDNVPVGGEYTLRFTHAGQTITFTHILIGEIWVVGGQSNSVGCEGSPVAPLAEVHYFTGKWREGVEPMWPFWYRKTTNAVNAWLSAAQTYYRLTGIPVGMMGDVNISSINAFMDAQHDMVRFKDLIERHGRGASVFGWYQGEADSNAEGWKTYQERLRQAAASLRRYAGNPCLRMGIVQLSHVVTFDGSTPYFGRVREAQRAFCVEDSHAVLIPALPYEHRDLIHLNAESYKKVGTRLGEALAEMEQASKPVWQGPRAVSARFADASRRSLIVTFDSAQRLQSYQINKRKLEDDWLVVDAKHQGFAEAGLPEVKSGVVTLRVSGAAPASVETDAKTQTVRVHLTDTGYLRPNRATISSLTVILDLPEPALLGATVSYALMGNATGSLEDEKGRPAAAFEGLKVQAADR